ncbi:unnamed protein product, partial [Symbiodinium sp. CCMP2456]
MVQDAFTTSQDGHREMNEKNAALFSALCHSHASVSSVLSQLAQSQHGKAIRERLLSKVSDTTAARYLRSVQLFFVAYEELGGQLEEINTGLFLDAFFALSRSSEDGPLSNSQNVLKALRWYKKLLGLGTLPDLYGPAFSLLSASSEQEKKESIPLPLTFVAFLEGILLNDKAPLEDQVWAGCFLTAISASLRFADCQHVRWSSLCVSQFLLRGICFRTKTTRSGAPWGLVSFGPISCSDKPGMTWLPRWIAALDSIWFSLKRPNTVEGNARFQSRHLSYQDDAADFLTREAKDEDLREARLASEAELGAEPKLPACTQWRAQVDPFMDSDGDEPGTQQSASATSVLAEAEPTWQSAAEPKEAPQPKGWPKAAAPPSQECGSFRFLVSTSG